MEQSEEQTKELELHIEKLQYLEFLYQEMKKRRKALHQDILEIIKSASIEELCPDLDLSVFDSLENRILRKNQIEDIQHLLMVIFINLRDAGCEHLELEILLDRWTMFHKKTFSPKQQAT